jgi:hypothetical protein
LPSASAISTAASSSTTAALSKSGAARPSRAKPTSTSRRRRNIFPPTGSNSRSRASAGIHNLGDIQKLLDTRNPGIVGAITGRAIYEGTLDVAEAQALCDGFKG